MNPLANIYRTSDDRFIALAKKYEKQPVAADALAWVLTNSRGFGAEAEKKRTEKADAWPRA